MARSRIAGIAATEARISGVIGLKRAASSALPKIGMVSVLLSVQKPLEFFKLLRCEVIAKDVG
jgi:hypothetical protein